MSRRAGAPDFAQWADAALAGTGWAARTVRDAAASGGTDLAAAALADGFAAAARGLAAAAESADGAT
jgi:hypothetical protein